MDNRPFKVLISGFNLNKTLKNILTVFVDRLVLKAPCGNFNCAFETLLSRTAYPHFTLSNMIANYLGKRPRFLISGNLATSETNQI